MGSKPIINDPSSTDDHAEARRAHKAAARHGSNDGWTSTGTLLTGIIVWGGIGWLLGRWTGWIGFLPIGVILGAALGVYLVVKQADNPPPLVDLSKTQRRAKQDRTTATEHTRDPSTD